jgi:SAM-dependent methyltransferase
MMRIWTAIVLCLVLCAHVASQENAVQPVKPGPAEPGSVVAKLAADIESVESVVSNDWVVEWLSQVRRLPPVESHTVTVNNKDVVVDEAMFYSARYGSPLSYARALDLAASAGFEGKPGSKVFDFGYGSIGHLRMLALRGHAATGVDVAPFLKTMYRDAGGKLGDGSVSVIDGRFPKDDDIVSRVGDNYDLVLSKNVLKRGYIHPAREVTDARMVIDLGVDDDTFLSKVASLLKPNGIFVIYNFCPAKAADDKPYIPWADGESPFSREAFQKAGFEVIHFDVIDDAEARRMGSALGWDGPGGMNLETDLFAWYTVVRKKSDATGVSP